MRIFVTGATGFVGSAIVPELIGAGHQVLGLARSDAAPRPLPRLEPMCSAVRSTIWRVCATARPRADAVIHAGFNHDFSNYAAAAETDRLAIETIGSRARRLRPPVHRHLRDGAGSRPAASQRKRMRPTPLFPRKSEEAAASAAARGVRVSVLRLPPSVHGDGDHGFVPLLIGIAREKGVSAYVGDGLNRWPAVHRLDAAHLLQARAGEGLRGSPLSRGRR